MWSLSAMALSTGFNTTTTAPSPLAKLSNTNGEGRNGQIRPNLPIRACVERFANVIRGENPRF
jgi:hypothetical protein